jgi:transposase
MNKVTIIAIDLAKNSFQVCKFNKGNSVAYNKAINRKALIELLGKHEPVLVAMEACGGAHYWARLAQRHGHQVKILQARAVKGLQLKQKTDKNDAYAIGIAAQLPHIRPCCVMSEEEQGLQSLERVRTLQIEQRTALINQIRGLLSEFGIVISKGIRNLVKSLPDVLEDGENGLPMNYRQALYAQSEWLKQYTEQIDGYDKLIAEHTRHHSTCQKLSKLEGVGPQVALGLTVRLGNAQEFKTGRDASSCIGLTPKQHSTGGKEHIGHISKFSADKRLRSLLFQGAMSVVHKVVLREPRTVKEQWLKKLIERRGKKIAAIALANKTVRTAVALIKNNDDYQPALLAV